MTGSNADRSASATAVHQSSSVRAPGPHRPAVRTARQRRATTSAQPRAAAMARMRPGPAATCPSAMRGDRG
jgi:hypothetical protein